MLDSIALLFKMLKKTRRADSVRNEEKYRPKEIDCISTIFWKFWQWKNMLKIVYFLAVQIVEKRSPKKAFTFGRLLV